MSVIIKDLEMPESCRRCKCHKNETEMWHDKYDMCCLKNIDIIELDVRPKWCPLIEVPTPHGRLIDSNELNDLIVDEFDGVCTYDVSLDEVVSDFQSIIDKCKTIIKMEE